MTSPRSKAVMTAWAGFLTAFLLGLCLTSCTTDTAGDDREIDWSLGDSLKAYSNVVITIQDPLDSTKVLTTVFSGKLTDPASLETYRIPDSIGGHFIILIQGYNAQGLLAMESRTEVKDGKASPSVKTPPDKLPGNQVTNPSALLTTLEVSEGDLSPAFSAQVEAYVLDLPFEVDSLTVNASAGDSGATLSLSGKSLLSGNPSDPFSLLVGDNVLSLVVKGRGGSPTKTYTLTVKRKTGNVARLASLLVSSGDLSPHFHPDSLNYVVAVAAEAETVSVAAAAEDPLARLEAGGEKLDSVTGKILVLAPGVSTTLQLAVMSQDSSATTTYTVKLTRALSAEARLESLLITGTSLTPEFHPDTTSYSATVAQASYAFLPVSKGKGAKITLNGSPVASGSLSHLIPATSNPLVTTLLVTAADGKTTKSYSVSVVKTAATTLPIGLDLAVPPGREVDLDSAFRSDRLAYRAVLQRADSVFNVRVTFKKPAFDLGPPPVTATLNAKAMATAVTSMNGEIATATFQGTAVLGLNILRVQLNDGPIYLVRIYRQPSQEINLSLLSLSAGALKPVFNAAVTSYVDTVPNASSSLTVSATPKDPLAKVIVRLKRWVPFVVKKVGATTADTLPIFTLPYKVITADTMKPGRASVPLELLVGHSLVEVEVVAEDTAFRKVYTVSVHRRASPYSLLSGLSVGPSSGSALTLNPAFARATLTYSTTTINGFVVVKPLAGEPGQTITVNGKAVVSGSQSQSITLVNGNNAIKVEVVAPDGVAKTIYTLNVTKNSIIILQK